MQERIDLKEELESLQFDLGETQNDLVEARASNNAFVTSCRQA